MKKTNAIVVSAKANETSEAKVMDAKQVRIPEAAEVKNILDNETKQLERLLSGEVEDPTKKKCSRCFKLGRFAYHDLADFSITKNGKYLSQCKACRVEQAKEWTDLKAVERIAYQKRYRKNNQRRYVPKAIAEAAGMIPEKPKFDGASALCIVTTQKEVKNES